MFWNRLFQICAFHRKYILVKLTLLVGPFTYFEERIKKIHNMCKHRPMVVFYILLQNVYNLFWYCKNFLVYFRICPSLGYKPPIHQFCQLFFSILFPIFWFLASAKGGVTECHFFDMPKVLLLNIFHIEEIWSMGLNCDLNISFVDLFHSYDILSAGMLWKPKEARILKNFINQRVNIR
jgi:hypothetical protein